MSRQGSGRVLVGILCGSLAPGCAGYTSTYVPPDPYRARAVWQDESLVVLNAGLLPSCDLSAMGTANAPPGEAPPGPPMRLDEHGRWSPVMMGAGFYWQPWNLPHHLLLQELLRHRATSGTRFAGLAVPSTGGGSGGGVDLPDGEGLAILAAVILVAAIVASVPVALILAASDPEDDVLVAQAVDRVNSYNDALRRWMSECAEAAQRGGPPPTPPTDVPAPLVDVPWPGGSDVPAPPDNEAPETDVPPPPGNEAPEADVPPPTDVPAPPAPSRSTW